MWLSKDKYDDIIGRLNVAEHKFRLIEESLAILFKEFITKQYPKIIEPTKFPFFYGGGKPELSFKKEYKELPVIVNELLRHLGLEKVEVPSTEQTLKLKKIENQKDVGGCSNDCGNCKC